MSKTTTQYLSTLCGFSISFYSFVRHTVAFWLTHKCVHAIHETNSSPFDSRPNFRIHIFHWIYPRKCQLCTCRIMLADTIWWEIVLNYPLILYNCNLIITNRINCECCVYEIVSHLTRSSVDIIEWTKRTSEWRRLHSLCSNDVFECLAIISYINWFCLVILLLNISYFY